ncbi:MAG TPA: right-handed parallel beta-helix repeat-containing protein [Phycisphaerae bacterium]|nr:right-handed parallel beta-helix repeat-containing protein [Phycisphaerae bacterium]
MCRLLPVVAAIGLGCCAATDVAAGTTLSGPVVDDQTWSGSVVITDDVTIEATVTVQPGTAILFAPDPKGRQITLRVGRPGADGRLALAGTQQSPITVQTAPDAPPGGLVVAGKDPAPLTARWALLTRMGTQDEPAVDVLCGPGEAHVRIGQCRFDRCGALQARLRGQAALTIEDCRLETTIGRTAVRCLGSGSAAKTIRSNRIDAALALSGQNLTVEGNIIVGPRAAIGVPTHDQAPVIIRDNFVHNTTDTDDGRFVLSCYEPEADIAGNILVGGSFVVEMASRHFHDNVLVGVPGLKSKLVPSAMTHQLVANLPPDAVFERNLLLGPAYAMLATSIGARNVQIRQNTFDGSGQAVRGLHLNMLAREPVAAVIRNNVFMRLAGPAVAVDPGSPPPIAEWSENVLCDVAQAAANGLTLPTTQPILPGITRLGLAGPAEGWPEAFERQLLDGQISVAQLRQHLATGYRPLPRSPLVVSAGEGGSGRYIGAVPPALTSQP